MEWWELFKVLATVSFCLVCSALFVYHCLVDDTSRCSIDILVAIILLSVCPFIVARCCCQRRDEGRPTLFASIQDSIFHYIHRNDGREDTINLVDMDPPPPSTASDETHETEFLNEDARADNLDDDDGPLLENITEEEEEEAHSAETNL